MVSPIEEFPVDKFHLILTLMLEAPFRLIRHALPHMYVRPDRQHLVRPRRPCVALKSAYVSAKPMARRPLQGHGAEGASHGVTSNCINPAFVRTPLVEGQLADQAKSGIPEDEVIEKIMLARAAIKRLIEPE